MCRQSVLNVHYCDLSVIYSFHGYREESRSWWHRERGEMQFHVVTVHCFALLLLLIWAIDIERKPLSLCEKDEHNKLHRPRCDQEERGEERQMGRNSRPELCHSYSN